MTYNTKNLSSFDTQQPLHHKHVVDTLEPENPMELQDHLRTLHQMGLELAAADSQDDLLRRAIKFGSFELGFERLGVFILNTSDNTWRGTFGIDLEGNLRDERDQTEGFSVLVRLMWHDLIAKRDQVIMRDDVVLYDSGREVGIGWHATAALWKGNEIFGLLFVDNVISQRPQRPYEHELIAMFSSTLAHLFTQKEMELELRASQREYHDLFENVPVVILVEDYSAVKAYIERLKNERVSDFRAYFDTNPDAVLHCARLIRIINANRAALDLYGVANKFQLPKVLTELLTDSDSLDLFREEIIDLAEGNLSHQHVTHSRKAAGKAFELDLKLRISPEAGDTWSRVYVVITQVVDPM